MTAIVDTTAEQRWTAWRLNSARLDALRASRMRKVFVLVGLAAPAWVFWSM